MTAVWLFTLIFGLFGLMLYRAFRFTALSVGTRSQEFHRVTRRFPAWRYFTRFTPLVFFFLGLQTIALGSLLFTTSFPGWMAVALMVFLLVLMGESVGCVLCLEWQYWCITQNV